ncbi:hypothetical protein, partial [Parasphingorhabdus sp.]
AAATEPTVPTEPDVLKQPEPAEQVAGANPASFSGIVDLVGETSVVMQSILKADIRLIEFAPPEITYESVRPIASADLRKIEAILKDSTGTTWSFQEGEGETAPSLDEQAEIQKRAERQKILDMPMVKAAFDAFPDARLVETTSDSELTKNLQEPHQTRSSLA